MSYDFEAVVEFCRDTVDDQVRAAVVIEDADHRTLFVRPDIRDRYRDRPGRLSGLVRGGRGLQRLFSDIDTDDTTLGTPEAAVVTFEHSILMQFIPEESTSLVVSFDREVGRDLVEFIGRCLDRL